jgi:4-hydroxybenzoate polyprenyltransferase
MSSATSSDPAPSKASALLALCRVSNLPTVWMNVVCAAVLAGAASPGLVVSLCLALSAFYCFGMALNDLCDREWDAREQPFRPFPSGRLTLDEAGRCAAGLFGAGFALLAFTPHRIALVSGAALVAVIVAYDVFHKRHPATVLLMAACRTGVFVVTAHAVAGEVAPVVWLAGGIAFAWTLLVTVVARHENTRGRPYAGPVIPRMLAAMAIVDGAVLAVVVHPAWLLAGLAAAALTRRAQRWVRGD